MSKGYLSNKLQGHPGREAVWPELRRLVTLSLSARSSQSLSGLVKHITTLKNNLYPHNMPEIEQKKPVGGIYSCSKLVAHPDQTDSCFLCRAGTDSAVFLVDSTSG